MVFLKFCSNCFSISPEKWSMTYYNYILSRSLLGLKNFSLVTATTLGAVKALLTVGVIGLCKGIRAGGVPYWQSLIYLLFWRSLFLLNPFEKLLFNEQLSPLGVASNGGTWKRKRWLEMTTRILVCNTYRSFQNNQETNRTI